MDVVRVEPKDGHTITSEEEAEQFCRMGYLFHYHTAKKIIECIIHLRLKQ